MQKDDTQPIFQRLLNLKGTEGLLQLDDEELRFFQATTGIQDVDALKSHIVAIQQEGFMIKPYPCIANFYFTDLRLARLPAYEQCIVLGNSRKDAIYLEIGACFGQDLRKAIVDGYPVKNAIATDVVPEFWEMGHKLFRTTPETFPVPLVPGDIFDPAFLDATKPFYIPPGTSVPTLSEVKTLNELRGHVSVIDVCCVFHVFSTEEVQTQLARALACLLSPEPGSIIIGCQNGLPEKGMKAGITFEMFCHSPESWTEMWDGQIFDKGAVKVDARLKPYRRTVLREGAVDNETRLFLEWSVTRL